MIDIARLRTFLSVAESMSFTATAKELHISQPTVSHHIKMLEQDLGVLLFKRTGSSIQLTEAGRVLTPWARRLVRESMQLVEMMESIDEKIVGHLRIACSTTSGKYILPQYAARFHARHSGIQVSILACTSENVVPQLLEDQVNLGVMSYETDQQQIELQEFFKDHIVLIAPASHPWADREYIQPEELLQVPMINREPTSGTRRVMLYELGKHDISLADLNIFLEVGNAEAIVKTVEAGYGVSFVSSLAAEWSIVSGLVVEVPVAEMDLVRTVYMARKSIGEPNRSTEAFWGFVHDPDNIDLLRLPEQ